MFKLLFILLTAIVIPAQQGRFGTCTPSVINLTIGGNLLQSEQNCVQLSRISEQGYFPIGTAVTFEYGGNSFNGQVTGYQFTWKANGGVVTEYVVLDGDVGPKFQVPEVAVAIDKVHQ